MSKLTLDEVIKNCLELAEKYETQPEEWCKECAADHRQLAEWLMEYKDLKAEQNDQYVFIHELMSELKEAKRLLKAAVKDLSITVAEVYNGGLVCECCKWKSQIDGCCCPNDGGCDVAYQWRYVDEAEKLLNN